jgi:hypothetical protein
MLSGTELLFKVEDELETLKRNYPKKNTVSFKSQAMLEKIRWIEYLLDVPHVKVQDLIK